LLFNEIFDFLLKHKISAPCAWNFVRLFLRLFLCAYF